MVAPTPLLENEQFMAELATDEPAQQVADRWKIAKSAITKYRRRLRNGEPLVQVKGSKGMPVVITSIAIPPNAPGYHFADDGTTVVIQTRPTVVEQTLADVHQAFRDEGLDPADFDISFKRTKWENGAVEADGTLRVLHYASSTARRLTSKDRGEPAWPVVQPAAPVSVQIAPPLTVPARAAGMQLGAKCADPQIGFRALPDGSFEPFHDDAAMALFVEVCRRLRPDKITILGDFLDLPSQSRWAQEAGFARTTQMALDRGHRFLAELRAACPDADIVLVEGNHDKRMQTHIETNAIAAFGLKRAGLPDSWPVMSLPNLLRLDELGVRYIDAYPAAVDWDNPFTRNMHGTRANSKGSTTSQYLHEIGHLDTWVGHTHRLEITYRDLTGNDGRPIRSYAANPGCLCRTDGAVPSVHGAIGADGYHARIVEDWQQGFGLLYFTEKEAWPQVYRIVDGAVMLDGELIYAPKGAD